MISEILIFFILKSFLKIKSKLKETKAHIKE